MRRTAQMVLVLAVFFAATAANPLALVAEASASGTAAGHTHGSRRIAPPCSAHTAVRHKTVASGCQPSYRAGLGAGQRAGRAKRQETSSARHARQTHHPSRAVQGRRSRVPESTTLSQDTGAVANESRQAVPEQNAQPAALRWKRNVMPPAMRGSLASLQRQNEKADAEGLERIEDEEDLSDRIARGALVPVPASTALFINQDLPEHHRYCRPWTARFLADLARAHMAQFHGPLQLSSAVRTVAYQKRLMSINGNAAPAEGDVVSPHLTGATIDIAKKGMSRQEIGWMRSWLLPLQSAGKVDVEEEFQQACFHITVYKSYAPARPPGSTARAISGRPGAGHDGAGHDGVPQPKRAQPTTRPSDLDVAGGTPALGR